MILYIDETENDECFIVAGILANADLEVASAYRRFKKSIKSMRIEDKYRSQVYTELIFLEKTSKSQKLMKTIINSQ